MLPTWLKRHYLKALFVLFCLLVLYAINTTSSFFRPLYLSPEPDHSARLAESTSTQNRHVEIGGKYDKEPTLVSLGVLAARNSNGWYPQDCDRSRKLRHVSIPAASGNLTFYVYDSANDDVTVSRRALRGRYFERAEIAQFLRLSRDLPLIDVGANVGLVTLQAAKQGRQVVALEPVYENALRLCRSALDFGNASLVHVIQNAVSSQEGNITLAMETQKSRTQYTVTRSESWGYGATVVHSIYLDRLLDVLPFKKAALKIDVESHEGHVLAGAQRLFQEMDIPLVWMEWKHVKGLPEYGGAFVLQFMQKHGMDAHDVISGRRLSASNFDGWPFSVLWRKVR